MTTLTPNTGGQSAQSVAQSTAMAFYRTAWRWHFYAGVFVTPFLIVLALSGLAMVFAPEIEAVQYRHLLNVTPQEQMRSVDDQIAAVKAKYPAGVIKKFRPPEHPTKSTNFSVNNGETRLNVYVNPYTAEVLGAVDHSKKWATIANKIHGTMLVGDIGDRILETASGWALVLTATGLYLWWPRRRKQIKVAFVPVKAKGRAGWKNFHSVGGFWVGGLLVFFLLTGMAWTGVWGKQIVQPWNTFPAAKRKEIPKSDTTMESLNRSGEHIVPWGLELAVLPASGSMAGGQGVVSDVHADSVVQFGRQQLSTFWVALPKGKEGVYTISASTMGGDTTDARKDRTIHIDQYSGKVLADIGWKDYNLGAKAMATGVALHMARYGLWSQLLAALSCLLITFLCVSGIVMWWIRRPVKQFRLVAPPMPIAPLWKGGVLIMIVLGIAFPLVGLTLIVVLLLDFILLRRIAPLKEVFS